MRPLLSRLARYELVALAAVAPLLLFTGWWTAAGLVLLVGIWLLRWWARGRVTRRTPLDWPIVILLAMTGVGLLVAADAAWSTPRAPVALLGVALYYGVVNSVQTARGRRWLAWGLVAGGLGYAAVGLLGTDWSHQRLWVAAELTQRIPALIRYAAPGAAGTELLNPRQLGAAMAVFAPVALALLGWGRGWPTRLVGGLAALAMGGVALLTGSLPALGALAAALALGAVIWSRWFLLLVPAGLAAAGVALWRYGVPSAAFLLSLDSPVGVAVHLRLDIWSRALAMIGDLPLTGAGLNQYAILQSEFYPGYVLGFEHHAHNLYLQTALDLGHPGLLAFLALMGAAGALAVRAWRRDATAETRALVAGAGLGLLAYLVYGLGDITPWGSRVQLGVWALLGALAAAGTAGEPAARPARGTWHRTVVVLVALGVAAPLLAPLWPVNLAATRAHAALLAARRGEPDPAALARAGDALAEALVRRPDHAHLYRLLGELEGWRGDDEAAVAAYRRAVASEAADPLARYGPAEAWLRAAEGGAPDRWADALRVYRHWMNRYPDRLTGRMVVAVALCEGQGDAAGARRTVADGLARVRPAGPLAADGRWIEAAGCEGGGRP